MLYGLFSSSTSASGRSWRRVLRQLAHAPRLLDLLTYYFGRIVMDSHLPSVCLPAGDKPLFRGTVPTGKHLDCRCGRRLIENYDEDAFLRVSLFCFPCDTTTETPGVPEGETLPRTLVNLGAKGENYLITETIDVEPGVGFTSDEEILKVQTATSPRWYASSTGRPGLREWLAELEGLYNEVTGGALTKQLASLARHQANRETGAREYPFAWALRRLSGQPSSTIATRMRTDEWTAYLWLTQFEGAVRMWAHHPRFRLVGETIASSFLHTTAQLIAAAALHRSGAAIGFPSETVPNQGNPDMYVRQDTKQRLHLEVKAPKELQPLDPLQPPAPSHAELEKTFRKSVKGSSHQINRTRPGYLVIASSVLVQPDLAQAALERSVRAEGRTRTGLTGLMALLPIQERNPFTVGARDFEVSFQVQSAENPWQSLTS